MCDYSLMAIPNRLAVSGEELIVHRFEAGSVGLASAFDIRKRQECRRVQSHGFWPKLKQLFNPPDAPVIPAVCIPPGAPRWPPENRPYVATSKPANGAGPGQEYL
jgi:hypothetical protein